ncbi:hypothetical protein [Ferrimonas balearica]|uniref:hypothetical protein n=1 Tax=Ferrimonas balearica TaxID=44012 RepID=UPI001C997F82|nr:hypothetical protein [Ferrimonas balearica]MBY5991327.1 hypothetical protein [Ferrimonas balearica]
MEDKDKFDAVIKLLDREDQLTNSRITWYLATQGFLITAVALSFTRGFEASPELRLPAIQLAAALAILLSVIVFIAAKRALVAKARLKRYWLKQELANRDQLPNPLGETSRWNWLTPPRTLPVLMVIFWLLVILTTWGG